MWMQKSKNNSWLIVPNQVQNFVAITVSVAINSEGLLSSFFNLVILGFSQLRGRTCCASGVIAWKEGCYCYDGICGLKMVIKLKKFLPFKFTNMIFYFKASNAKTMAGGYGTERVVKRNGIFAPN